jgi:hypothetical protein
VVIKTETLLDLVMTEMGAGQHLTLSKGLMENSGRN